MGIISADHLTELYHRHVQTVYRVCFMFMKNRYDAEDALQETFIKLLGMNKTFESTEHEKAWLIRTSSNVCKNMLKAKSRKHTSLEEAEETPAPEEERDETLEKVLALPDKYKTAIYLFYYEGYSCAEIAKIIHKTESTVRSHLHRGRTLLRETLGKEL